MRPVVERLARGLAQGSEEVVQAGVAPGVPVDVCMQPRAECVVAERSDELLDDRRTLLVGDGVEVADSLVGVFHARGHWVRGHELILAVRRRTHLSVEDVPGIVEARGVGQAPIREVGGECLVQPQVIPPAHRHEVAEPHVSKLMQHDLTADEALAVCGRVTEEEPVVEGDGTDVLHGTGVELRHEELVVLAEGVGPAEQAGVVVHALARHLEDLSRAALELSTHRGTSVEAEGYAFMHPIHAHERAGDQGEQVGRERDGAREVVHPTPVAKVADVRRRLRGDDFPARGGRHQQPVGGLDIGLVEAGEDAVRRERLEVAVQVRRAVLGIDEVMEAIAGGVVGVLVLDDDAVVGAKVLRWEPQAVPTVIRLHDGAIEAEPPCPAGEVHEQRRGGGVEVELDDGATRVCLAALGQLETQLIADVVDA